MVVFLPMKRGFLAAASSAAREVSGTRTRDEAWSGPVFGSLRRARAERLLACPRSHGYSREWRFFSRLRRHFQPDLIPRDRRAWRAGEERMTFACIASRKLKEVSRLRRHFQPTRRPAFASAPAAGFDHVRNGGAQERGRQRRKDQAWLFLGKGAELFTVA